MKTFRFAFVLLSASVLALGCERGPEEDVVYSCDNPDIGHKDSKGNPDPCHLEEKEAQSACGNGCAEIDLEFEPTFVALWMGPDGKAPACPKADVPRG